MVPSDTPQSEFWSGKDGDNYISRNVSDSLHAANLKFFSDIFTSMGEVPSSVLELGANVGMNFKAISALAPEAALTGVEVNETAAKRLGEAGFNAIQTSIEDFETSESFDLTMTKGVLIHLNPESLPATYAKLYNCSKRWIVIGEYYSPSPVGVEYRGQRDLLFKRDFAGEMLDKYPDLSLHSYGFAYHRGPFAQDDINWFVLRK